MFGLLVAEFHLPYVVFDRMHIQNRIILETENQSHLVIARRDSSRKKPYAKTI